MKLRAYIAGLSLLTITPVLAQGRQHRMIDLCAQDGYKIEIFDLWMHHQTSVSAGRVGDLDMHLQSIKRDSADAILIFSREGKVVHQTTLKDFGGPYGWLTVSDDSKHFAVSWKSNATVSATKVFSVKSDGKLSEDGELIAKVQQQFLSDAHRACTDPAVNLQAIKWIDGEHLLLAANSWNSLASPINFYEGFILDPAKHLVQRRLTEHQLLNLPAVCTWNIVPSGHRW